jgi:hypothetical protein
VTSKRERVLVGLLVLYAAASLLHFAHNAEYLSDYPNLPTSFTRAGIYLAWTGLACIGFAGIAIYGLGRQMAGLLVLGLYAAFGFDGLLHYTLAPVGAHSAVMNFTIWLEVLAAGALFFAVVLEVVKRGLRHVIDAGTHEEHES